MKYILMDVEGTTTSISFVHDTLFPFAKTHLQSFIIKNLQSEDTKIILADTKKTILEEQRRIIDSDEAIEQLSKWIDQDRKHPALKKIQGMIWKTGYETGEIKGHVYSDVPESLKRWKNAQLTLGIYSSGSIEAQIDLFKNSSFGNLALYFSNHFDTSIGHKREVQSYITIAKKLNLPSSEILFLSDTKEELDAAKSTGFQTIQLVRLEKLPYAGHNQVQNFSEIPFYYPET